MNRLSSETSPYLLQHKSNPVHWFGWCEEAFQEAHKQNKPILVSIGYSSCHWCHVMEKESFEDEYIAGVMNELFINIKVDREEYPDIDHFYMDAVQAMTGSGGWPLNVFLTEDKKPFYGGTYFPPQRAHGRASWVEVLQNVSSYYHKHREEVEKQGDKLWDHLRQPIKLGTADLDKINVDTIIEKLMSTADTVYGGFGIAPKFPSTHCLQLLLLSYELNHNKEVWDHVRLTLDLMSAGGMYDLIGGGFSRYSTDLQWRIPHFEKMLYDNALLLELYAKGYKLSNNPDYATICSETILWLQREMTSEEGGFYTALDADSEGEEGLFYTWKADELKSLLKNDFSEFSHHYSVEEEGNWEERNILYRSYLKVKPESEKNEHWKQILYTYRSKRIWPLLDDKIILSWNALMVKALIQCHLYTYQPQALLMAEKNMNFLWECFRDAASGYYHTVKSGQRKIHAYSDDLSFWVEALIEYGHVTGNTLHYHRAGEIMRYLFTHYTNSETPLFDFNHHQYRPIEYAKQELYDGATPSSNAVILRCIRKLSLIFQNETWTKKGQQMANSIRPMAEKYPYSFSVWLKEMIERDREETEIVIIGSDAVNAYISILRNIPSIHCNFMVSDSLDETLPGHLAKKNPGIYVCKNRTCYPPVSSWQEALTYIM